MVTIMSLWLPILLSAVFVFIVSSIIHMLLKYHQNDYSKLSNETEIMDALRPFSIPRGNYFMPSAKSMEEMKEEAYVEKANKGPVALLTVAPNGMPNMGKSLMLWFLYSLLMSVIAAYISGRALGPGAHYLEVFRFAGCTAFAGYALALLHESIWYHRKWSTTIKSMFDGFLYSLVTAGTFGWLWP